MLQRSIWSWRGADPPSLEEIQQLYLPITNGRRLMIFFQRKHDDATRRCPSTQSGPPDEAHHSLIEALHDRFRGDPHRWDASRRDQFIILGVMATAGGYGVRKLIHSLGMGLANGVRGANTVRAAKIALSRLAKPLGLQLFAPAVGNGQERIHMFNDEELAEIIARYVFNHDASILLPATNLPSLSL